MVTSNGVHVGNAFKVVKPSTTVKKKQLIESGCVS